jgi:hypothetical protein
VGTGPQPCNSAAGVIYEYRCVLTCRTLYILFLVCAGMSQDSLVDIATSYIDGRRWIPGKCKRYFFVPKHWDKP